MKRLSLIVFCVFAFVAVQAQHQINSFFAPDGTVRLETEELFNDSVFTLTHRAEDIVWRRDIYRIIDMRQKQNFQLYYPTDPKDPTYQSFFRLILGAIENGLPIYEKNQEAKNIKPIFSDSTLLKTSNIDNFLLPFWVGEAASFDRDNERNFVLNIDPVTKKISFQDHAYENYIKNQTKYLVYEVVFFSRATSRLYRKIVAIAPLQPDLTAEGIEDPAQFMRESVKFWMLYDQLRPYLAKQYIIPTQNETKRVTFDEFFEKRMFSSYIIGEGNIYNRMILDYCKTEEEAKKEQARIESELLTFEQDLWEY